jgi:hypothetical protein
VWGSYAPAQYIVKQILSHFNCAADLHHDNINLNECQRISPLASFCDLPRFAIKVRLVSPGQGRPQKLIPPPEYWAR